MVSDTADNEELQVLWVGQSASPQLFLDLFGIDDVFQMDLRIVRVPFLSNRFFFRQRNLIRSLPPQKDRNTSFGLPLL
jgi:protein transport protein SEC24